MIIIDYFNYHIQIWSCCWINLRCMMTKMKKKIGKEIISVDLVTKKFGDFKALDNVSAKIYEKEVVVVLGPSGSGKSTFIRTINGLEPHDSGTIKIGGTEINNNLKKFSNCSKFYVLLVKPNFGCSTKTIHSGVKNFTRSKYNRPKKIMFNPQYLSKQNNALENVAFLKYPKLKKIKLFLENLKKPLFVRMTGSGSVLVAYFLSKKDCEMAKVHFKRKFKNYWCNTSKTL